MCYKKEFELLRKSLLTTRDGKPTFAKRLRWMKKAQRTQSKDAKYFANSAPSLRATI